MTSEITANLNQNVSMSDNIAVVNTVQKQNEIKLLNKKLEIKNEVKENQN